MPSKNTYATYLQSREKAALTAKAEAQKKATTEHDKHGRFQHAADEAELHFEDLESRLTSGEEDVTALDVATAQAEVRRTDLLRAGSEGRLAKLVRQSDVTYRKDVAEIVLQELLEKVFPGATGHATFHTTGFKHDEVAPTELPCLVVSQRDGGMGDKGVGAAQLDITWHRSPLHASAEPAKIRQALVEAGFSPGRELSQASFVVRRTKLADQLRGVNVGNVSEQVPVISGDVDGRDFDRMGDNLATSLEGTVSSERARGGDSPVRADGVRGDLVASQTEDGYRFVTVRAEAIAWKDERHPAADRIVLDTVVSSALRAYEGQVVRGLGRCITVEQVAPTVEQDGDLRQGKRYFAMQAVYKSKAA